MNKLRFQNKSAPKISTMLFQHKNATMMGPKDIVVNQIMRDNIHELRGMRYSRKKTVMGTSNQSNVQMMNYLNQANTEEMQQYFPYKQPVSVGSTTMVPLFTR